MRKRLVLPPKIKVGPYEYDVRRCSAEDMHDARGDFQTDVGIRIAKGLRRHVVIETLQHEIFHAIWYSYNLPDKAKEENAVSVLSTGYMAVLVDNPEYAKLLQEL